MTGRYVLLCVVLAVGLGVTALGCGPPPYPKTVQHALLDRPLPEIRRETLEGAHLDTASLRGRVVVVKFFAEYCEPCKRSLPAAERVHKAHADVLFVGVAEDQSRDAAKNMVKMYELTFPVVHDGGNNVLSGRFRVNELPMTFVADKQGLIRWVGAAGQSEEDLERAVQAAR